MTDGQYEHGNDGFSAWWVNMCAFKLKQTVQFAYQLLVHSPIALRETKVTDRTLVRSFTYRREVVVRYRALRFLTYQCAHANAV